MVHARLGIVMMVLNWCCADKLLFIHTALYRVTLQGNVESSAKRRQPQPVGGAPPRYRVLCCLQAAATPHTVSHASQL